MVTDLFQLLLTAIHSKIGQGCLPKWYVYVELVSWCELLNTDKFLKDHHKTKDVVIYQHCTNLSPVVIHT